MCVNGSWQNNAASGTGNIPPSEGGVFLVNRGGIFLVKKGVLHLVF